jgi:hypothetical protein
MGVAKFAYFCWPIYGTFWNIMEHLAGLASNHKAPYPPARDSTLPRMLRAGFVADRLAGLFD